MEKIKLYTYYIIIGVVSLIALLFLPMVGSSIGLEMRLPDTIVGWIVYCVTKLIVAALNVIIFYCFMQQAKVNVKENKKYIEANEILERIEHKSERAPRSPKEWTRKQYGSKGITIFITTLLAAVSLTQAILTFDYITMLTYLFTIIMGLIFGVLQMKNAEIYWTTEYYEYALKIKREEQKACSKSETRNIET
jgi:hypothetical protein